MVLERIETRKIFKLTSGSYSIVLPKDWIKSQQYKQQKPIKTATIIITNKYLIITTTKPTTQEITKIKQLTQ